MTQLPLSKTLFIILGSLLSLGTLGLVGVFVWFAQNLQPVNPHSTQLVGFVIPKGQSVEKIARRLEEEQLIRSAFTFRYVVWKGAFATKLQAGSFELSASLSPEEIAQRLTMGSDDVWVTIPEGKRKEEVAEYFSDFKEFDQQEFLKLSENDEGYLFPDTYLFPAQSTAETVHDQLRNNFDKVVKSNSIEAKLKKNNATLKNIVIMASLLEREAQTETDMKMVAGILYNRLQNDMPLQVDATMQYAKGYDPLTKSWWSPPLSADKNINSPFNTYKVTGLPPAPIANPGLKALKAALEPTPSEYIFYLTDTNGQMHYAKTYDEHLKNIQKFLR